MIVIFSLAMLSIALILSKSIKQTIKLSLISFVCTLLIFSLDKDIQSISQLFSLGTLFIAAIYSFIFIGIVQSLEAINFGAKAIKYLALLVVSIVITIIYSIGNNEFETIWSIPLFATRLFVAIALIDILTFGYRRKSISSSNPI